MTRKEYVLTVVEQMKENPRAVLAGHGIQAAVLQQIVSRPDIMAKLAVFAYSTKNIKKGAAGLKKAPNLKITGYKNFADFNVNAREDVETFIGGLQAEDAASFKNSENILTILMLPDSTATQFGETPAEDVNMIISGKSVALTFDSAVRKEFKIPGGIYLTIMFGDSIIRPAEEQIAERKEKVNKAKQVKRTPAKIINELKAKAKKKLNALDSKRKELEAGAYSLTKELEQFANIGAELGVNSKLPSHIIGGINKANKVATEKAAVVKAEIDTLSAEDKKVLALALKYAKAGKMSLVKQLLKELNNPTITDYVINGLPKSGNEMVDSRKKGIIAQIKALVAKNEQLLVDLSLAPTENMKRSVQSSISRNNSKIKELRAALGTYKNISVSGMVKKAQMLKETNAAIQANIAAGATIDEALNAAITKLEASPAQKQIIKQQVIEQVANGTPMQYAVQQAIQDNVEEPVQQQILSDNTDIQNLIDTL